jgi:carboxymethylenebutenolidase
LLHLSSLNHNLDPSSTTTAHTYPVSSAYFAIPQVAEYDPGSASLAHSRSLVFLRKQLGGPIFDLEAIWDEHCFFEFEERNVAKTMGTMVVRSE